MRLRLSAMASAVAAGLLIWGAALAGWVVVTLVVVGPSSVSTGAWAVVRLEPASQDVPAGEGFTVDVVMEGGRDLGAFEFWLTYDPAVAAFVSATEGSFLGSTGRAIFCPDVIAAAGMVRFGCVSSLPGAPPSGSGILTTVVFQAVAPGPSPLGLVVALADQWGGGLDAAASGGSVNVFPLP